jgi:hypothetical protein
VRTSARHPIKSKRGRTDAACGETVPEWGSEESSLPHNVKDENVDTMHVKTESIVNKLSPLKVGKEEKTMR